MSLMQALLGLGASSKFSKLTHSESNFVNLPANPTVTPAGAMPPGANRWVAAYFTFPVTFSSATIGGIAATVQRIGTTAEYLIYANVPTGTNPAFAIVCGGGYVKYSIFSFEKTSAPTFAVATGSTGVIIGTTILSSAATVPADGYLIGVSWGYQAIGSGSASATANAPYSPLVGNTFSDASYNMRGYWAKSSDLPGVSSTFTATWTNCAAGGASVNQILVS